MGKDMELEEKKESLAKLREEISRCQKCSLARSRSNTVPGEGNVEAEIMFVGEAPGFNEDQQGIPFCGAAGRFLDELLGSIGANRKDVFIANTLKCRPPENRDPLPEEKEACRPYLDKQIEIIVPKIIITLGKHSTETFLPGVGGITKLRAKLFRRPGNRYFFPLYHPAAALHNGTLRDTLTQDFNKIPEALKKVEAETETALSKNKEKNLKLF